MPSTMHGSCPDCGATFDASTPPALVDLILDHRCARKGTAVWNQDAGKWDLTK